MRRLAFVVLGPMLLVAGACSQSDAGEPAEQTAAVGQATIAATDAPPSGGAAPDGETPHAEASSDDGATDLLAGAVLALAPRPPIDIGLFASDRLHLESLGGPYPAGPAMRSGEPAELDEQSAEESLRAHYGPDSAGAAMAIAVFRDKRAASLIIDPKLRAAFAAQVGTVWEPAIEFFLSSDRFEALVLKDYSESRRPDALAFSEMGAGGRRLLSVSATAFADASFAQAIASIGHEINHDDFLGGPAEEAIIGTLTAVAHLQVLARQPSLLAERSPMARMNNTQAMALLNSREAGSGEIRILAEPATLFPGGNERFEGVNFWRLNFPGRFTKPLAVSADLAPVLAEELASISAARTDFGDPLEFSEELAERISPLALERAGLTDTVLVRLHVGLGLISIDEIADVTGMSADEASEAFMLRP